MKKKFVNLDKKWKEIVYAFSGFGPNLLMVLMGAYFSDAVNPSALPEGSLQAISSVCLITPGLFSILWFLGKVFDGIIDIPFAAITDNIKTKWGRRRIPIAICFLPMVISFALCWIPISQTNQLANTIWISINSIIFFATYTMNLITFYGSLSTVCSNEKQRISVSSYKSFFDTISYCIVYALVPVILAGFQMHIDKLVLFSLPIMFTMIIPLFMIKEGEKFEKKAKEQGYDIVPLAEEKKVGLWESIKLTFTNKVFMKWCLVNCCSFFGLQMFLVSMNALITGGMGLNETQMAILNTFAFGPVPIMLYLFNKLKAKKGIRFAYQTCLICFAVAILSFDLGSEFIMGSNVMAKMIIGIIGGLLGSWAIGPFFMMSYLIPAQVSAVEEKLTKKNHSAMYFAAQAVTSSIVGAAASGLVYENIKMLFIAKGQTGIQIATTGIMAREEAAILFGVGKEMVFNLGTLLVPVIVSVFCLIGYILTFLMPKNYTPKELAKRLGLEKEYENNKDLFDEEESENKVEEETLIVNIALWILSGTIFGIIWRYGIIKNINKFKYKKIHLLHWVVSTLVFPYSAYTSYVCAKAIKEKCDKEGIKCANNAIIYAILAFVGLEIISQSILQHKLNLISKKTKSESSEKNLVMA